MSRNRMFGDEEPPAPSPRTTIVGGRPPEETDQLPPVPTGIQRLMRLASVDGKFRRQLVERRAAVAPAAGLELTASERAILAAIPAAQLEGMIANLPPPAEDRRTFLRHTAASAVVLLGGAALASSCQRPVVQGARADEPPPKGGDAGPSFAEPPRPVEPAPPTAGISPDEPPPRPEKPFPAPGGAATDIPSPHQHGLGGGPTRGIRSDVPPRRPYRRDMETEGGAAPHEPPPRPNHRDMATTGGAAPDEPPPRPVQRDTVSRGGAAPDEPPRPTNPAPPPAGIAPDVPRPKPSRDAGVDGPRRPKRVRPTKGSRP